MVGEYEVGRVYAKPVNVFSLETREKIGPRHAVHHAGDLVVLFHRRKIPLERHDDGKFYPMSVEEEKLLYH